MSGLAAILHLSGEPVAVEQLAGMTNALAHRGPDGVGHWVRDAVGLGHSMFHTTPESKRETQPLLDVAGRLCLILDGRVDNRAELRSAIVAAGIMPRDDTDAELILQAYACWGESCVERIIGEWAFVLWDDRRRRLVFARDPVGVRQLLYYRQDGRLLIATEPAGIFGYRGLPREVNRRVLGQYLNDNWKEFIETLDAGVRRLPGGHVAVLADGALTMRRYWPGDWGETIRYKRSAEYAEHFRDLFAQVVTDYLRAAGPVGILLSGGLDSSSLACMADDLMRRQGGAFPTVEALSVVYPGLECDESVYRDAAADSLRMTAHRLAFGEHPLSTASLDRAAEFPDILFDPSVMAPILIYTERARERGMRVLLDGIGGDELFAALPTWSLPDILRRGDLPGLYRQLRAARDYTGHSLPRLFLESSVGPLLPEPLKGMAKRLRPRPEVHHREQLGSWIAPEFAARWRLEDYLSGSPSPLPPTKSIAKQHLYRLFTASYNVIFALEFNDWALARLGFEKRHPYFDRRLVEFCLRIPEEERAGGEIGKYLLRRAMADLLPPRIALRQDKVTFDCLSEQQLNLRQRRAVDIIFQSLCLEREGVLVRGEAQRLLADYRAGYAPAGYPAGAILSIELWMRSNHFSGEFHGCQEEEGLSVAKTG